MTDMTERVDRLDAMIAEDRVVRHEWTDGHERACLLAALSPEAGSTGDASACPAHVMPTWLAYMTPWIDDRVSDVAWHLIIRRYAALARRWSVLDSAAWERARVASLVAIVSEARLYVPPSEESTLAAIDGVLAWLRSGAPAERAAAAASLRAASAAAAASWALRAASYAAASASLRAASAAAASAAASSWALRAASAACASTAAVVASRAAAADRIATAVLDAIEAEIEREER